jgi:molybdopterin converting factor small subunit
MTVQVYIPSPLASYTGEANRVQAGGASVAELLAELDRRYPGIRFRIVNEQDEIRRHIRIFVNREQVRDLAVPLRVSDEVMIVCALSGG